MTSLVQWSTRDTMSAQSSDQPQQAFSASLLAASKGYSETGSANDGSNKAGHRQSSAPDDAKAPSTVSDSSAVLSSIVSQQTAPLQPVLQAQQTQGTDADVVAPLQLPLDGPATTGETSTGVAGQLIRSGTAAGLAGTESSTAQTGTAQPADVPSSGAPLQLPLDGPATTGETSTGVAGQLIRSGTAAGLAGTESNIAQTGTAQPADVPSSVAPLQLPLDGPATTENTSTGVASQFTQSGTAAGLAGTESSIAQTGIIQTGTAQPADVPSSGAPLQLPLDGLATTEETSTGVTSQITQSVTAAWLARTESNIAQTGTAQPADVPSSVAPLQLPLDGPATTENTSTGVAGQLTRSGIAVGLAGTESNIAQTGIVQTSIAQPAGVPSSVAPLQLPLGELATTEETLTGVAGQLTRSGIAVGLAGTESNIAQTGIVQTSIAQPAGVPSSVAQLGNDSSQTASNLPGARIQGMKASSAASPKSGNGDSSEVTPAISDAAPTTAFGGVQDSLPKAVLNALPSAVQNAVANGLLNGNSAPVLRAALNASAKEVVASALSTGSTVQANPPAAAPDQSLAATTISVSGGTADQLVALPQPAWSLGTSLAGASSLNSSSVAKSQATASNNGKDASTDQTGLKQHAQSASEGGSKTISQDATPSGDPNQGGNTSQAQNTAPVPMNFASHSTTAIAQAQNTATASLPQASPTPASAAGIAAKTTDNAATASTLAPQALPVINTAKLIQSIGQSEMRVGMRSNEFGSISISTSATRDSISAQISLDHGELAKTLAAHLPEMQARLGGNQAMDVRIDMNGAGTRQGTGTSGSMANGSSDQSRSGRQQAGNAAASYSGSKVAEQQLPPAAAAKTTGYTRLDIRV
jgi:hypothetical protein